MITLRFHILPPPSPSWRVSSRFETHSPSSKPWIKDKLPVFVQLQFLPNLRVGCARVLRLEAFFLDPYSEPECNRNLCHYVPFPCSRNRHRTWILCRSLDGASISSLSSCPLPAAVPWFLHQSLAPAVLFPSPPRVFRRILGCRASVGRRYAVCDPSPPVRPLSSFARGPTSSATCEYFCVLWWANRPHRRCRNFCWCVCAFSYNNWMFSISLDPIRYSSVNRRCSRRQIKTPINS